MEKLFNLLVAMVALATMPAEQRDEKKMAADLREIEVELGKCKEAGFESARVKTMEAEAAQLRKELDEQSEALREMKRIRVAAPTMMQGLYANGAPKFRLSTPGLAKDFADFAIAVRNHSKDLGPYDAAEGGYMIPDPQTIAEIWSMAESVAVAMQIGGERPCGPGGFHLLRGTTNALAYWKAAGAAAKENTPNLGRETVVPETLIALTDVDSELDEDSMVTLGNYLASQFAFAMGQTTDLAAFKGDGTSTYAGMVGILNSDRVSTVDMGSGDVTFAHIAYGDTIDLETEVGETALINAAYLMHRSIKGLVKNLLDTANHPIWQATVGREPDDLNGYPLRTAGCMRTNAEVAVSTTFATFGDFNQGLVFGRRGQLRIDYSSDVNFKNFQQCWRAVMRIKFACNGYTAAELAADTTLANPLANLKTAAN